METSAEYSRCRRYRYALWSKWSAGPSVLFVLLNPSNGDENSDDPTVRRCIGFARSWGFGSMAMANLFALRTQSPDVLAQAAAPIGRSNDAWLEKLQDSTQLTIAAWGNHGHLLGRAAEVRPRLSNLHILGMTQLGEPQHPLYIAQTENYQPWEQLALA